MVCVCGRERETLIVFLSSSACIILIGVTGIRLFPQNTFTPTPFVCVCVRAYVRAEGRTLSDTCVL